MWRTGHHPVVIRLLRYPLQENTGELSHLDAQAGEVA